MQWLSVYLMTGQKELEKYKEMPKYALIPTYIKNLPLLPSDEINGCRTFGTVTQKKLKPPRVFNISGKKNIHPYHIICYYKIQVIKKHK